VEVADWLKCLGVDQYARQFHDNHITFDLLPTLTTDDLKDLGVISVGHRRRLLDAIARLRATDKVESTERPPIEQGEAAAERRQVTVLFADLTGYTELSRLLDAEVLERVLTAFFDVADAAVVEHGGTIDKHIGDCVMAVFGAPVAHGNDAERAVLAALRIRASVPSLCERLGRDIGVHVGLASGEVLASQIGSARHRAYTVTGESVNLASRLTDRASSGEILLSSAVYRGLADRLDCNEVGDVDVKGFSSPVRVWRLLGIRQASAGHRPFVGRASELGQFQAAVATCRDLGRGRVIYVRGEAGLGKTRLVEEFQDAARQSGFVCHSGLVLDFGAESGRDAVCAVLRDIAIDGNSVGLSDEAGGKRIAALVDEGRIHADHAIFMYDLLNIAPPVALQALQNAMETATRTRGLLETITAFVASTAKTRPLLIVVEDLHWSDDSLLAQVAAVADAANESRLLLVLTSRNVGDPLQRAWHVSSPLLTIDLAPLHHQESLTLAQNVLQELGPLAASCVERAAGNPLFLEQLLRNAGEQLDGAVPDSVQSLVQARLDRLEPSDKQALQAASVFGQRFPLAGLRALIEDASYGPGKLVEQSLLRPFADEFLFGHALIRDAVYATLLWSRQRELHNRAAAWFAERDSGLHAQHLDRAENAGAPKAYLAAARAEANRYRYEQALSLIQRGAILARDPNDRFLLTSYQGELLLDVGRVAEAHTAFEEALAQCQDDAQRCRAWLGVAAVKRIIDDLPGALADIERAEGVAAHLSLRVEAARAHFLHGNLLFPQGDLEGCLREHGFSFDLARQAASAELEAAALGGLGDAEYARGRLLSARRHFADCIDLSRCHGFGRIEVANLPMFALMRLFAGETRAALEEALAAIEMASKVGHLRAQTIAHHAAYNARHALGEFAAAQENVDAALDLARQLKARRFEAEALAFGAELDRLAGRQMEARIAIREALIISAETGMAYFGPVYYGIQALIETDETDRRAALSAAETLLAGNTLAHNHLLFRRDAIEATILLRDWDEVERHADALEAFVRPEPLPWTIFLAARARAFASYGRGHRSVQLDHELQRLYKDGDRLGICLSTAAQLISPGA
jgi:class 3 adenylate cyclase/tetratricopeptide (TPR) repeat protein